MKRIITLFLALLYMMTLPACKPDNGEELDFTYPNYFVGEVMEIYEDCFRVRITDLGNCFFYDEEVYVHDENAGSGYAVGDHVKIRYDGALWEYDPARVGTESIVRVDPEGNTLPAEETAPDTIAMQETVHVSIQPPWFEDLGALVSQSDTILVGEVTGIAYERIDKVEKGLVQSSMPYYQNLTRYTVTVKEVISGNFAEGATITLDQTGGLAGGVNVIVDGVSYMEDGNTYLLFLNHPETAQGKGYCENMLVSMWEGFSLLSDGNVIPQPENRLIPAAAPYDEVKGLIQTYLE